MSKTVIILGSAGSNGDTHKKVQQLAAMAQCDVIDLNNYNFSHYDYEHKNRGDDYIKLMQNIIDQYDTLVFATPVYWYAMSEVMKIFFDRLTDLLTIEKDLGRKLRGKNLAAMSCSTGDGNLGEAFWLPFIESANYLGMNYLGHIHAIVDHDEEELKHFATLLATKDS